MPRRVIDPDRPLCPVCDAPAYRHGIQDGVQMWNCQGCGASGNTETFAANALARAAVEHDEVCIPLPRVLDKAEVNCSHRRCERCIYLAQCHAAERGGLPLLGERMGRVLAGGALCEV